MDQRTSAAERDVWFSQLRERFLALARRRVPPDAAEDLVQDALRIVHEKSASIDAGAEIEGLPTLAWCFLVLRNVIGNYYQRERTRAAADPEDERVATVGRADVPTPLEALEARRVEDLFHEAVEQIDAANGNCGRYLRALLAGEDPATLARRDAVPAAALYRRLYRCRQKLRVLLERKGVLT